LGKSCIFDAAETQVSKRDLIEGHPQVIYSDLRHPPVVAMRKTQNILLAVTVVSLSAGILLMLMLLNRFIFKRLQKIIVSATRLVGGDFETEIKTGSDDEVGQLEHLFEQFRNIFVSVLAEISEAQVTK
jgi:signal transduction histidine kinase